MISDQDFAVTHTNNCVFLNETINKLLWNAVCLGGEDSGGLTGALVRIQTANVSGYMLINTPVNHSVNEESGCVSVSLSALSCLTHPWRGDAWRSRWQPIWWLSLAWLVLSSPPLLGGWNRAEDEGKERNKKEIKRGREWGNPWKLCLENCLSTVIPQFDACSRKYWLWCCRTHIDFQSLLSKWKTYLDTSQNTPLTEWS